MMRRTPILLCLAFAACHSENGAAVSVVLAGKGPLAFDIGGQLTISQPSLSAPVVVQGTAVTDSSGHVTIAFNVTGLARESADIQLDLRRPPGDTLILRLQRTDVPIDGPNTPVTLGESDVAVEPDTDADGISDLTEALNQTDPDDASSLPALTLSIALPVGGDYCLGDTVVLQAEAIAPSGNPALTAPLFWGGSALNGHGNAVVGMTVNDVPLAIAGTGLVVRVEERGASEDVLGAAEVTLNVVCDGSVGARTCPSCAACVPDTCGSAGWNCGDLPTGCGGSVDCGSCESATCQAGTCLCDEGLSACPDGCKNLLFDPNHCGTCGLGCGAEERCRAGHCCLDADGDGFFAEASDPECPGPRDCDDSNAASRPLDGVVSTCESCDDGNLVADDGCSPEGVKDETYLCPTPGKPCKRAGDGTLDYGEQCDDGNLSNGDGCTLGGMVEAGASCVPATQCTNGCGNESINGVEACDSGTTLGHYDCASDCQPRCIRREDCAIGFVCHDDHCVALPCGDSHKGGLETDVDCGGGECAPCASNAHCTSGADCLSGLCSIFGRCVSEMGCLKACGGACGRCPTGHACASNSDCSSDHCDVGSNACLAPSCGDSVKNDTETDVDCGGTCGARCAVTKGCLEHDDCTSGLRCQGGVCTPACSDGVWDAGESDVDCGGACSPCESGALCFTATDCQAPLNCTGICE